MCYFICINYYTKCLHCCIIISMTCSLTLNGINVQLLLLVSHLATINGLLWHLKLVSSTCVCVCEGAKEEELCGYVQRCNIHDSPGGSCSWKTPRTRSYTHIHTLNTRVRWCSPDICICHSEGQYVSASVISKHFGVNKLLIFSISTDDNVASSWESGKMLSGGHSLDVNCVWQMVLSV